MLYQACPGVSTERMKTRAQHVRFTDGATGVLVPEVLVIPQYVSIDTRPELLGKKKGETYRDYAADPFVYRNGSAFRPVVSKTRGIVWVPGCAFTGKEKLMRGALILARGYRPLWLSTSHFEQAKDGLRLEPAAAEESARALSGVLTQIDKGTLQMPEECKRFYLDPCALELRFKRKEMETVRAFLQHAAG
jgi:hypothetical protein